MPKLLAEEPELTWRQSTLLHAYFLLTPDRPLGMGGAGGIPTMAIFAMADEIGEDRMDFLTLCRAMDGVYLEHANSKTKKPNTPHSTGRK